VGAEYTGRGGNFSSTNSLQPSTIPTSGAHSRIEAFKVQDVWQYSQALGFALKTHPKSVLADNEIIAFCCLAHKTRRLHLQ